jgi:hypothetical protein
MTVKRMSKMRAAQYAVAAVAVVASGLLAWEFVPLQMGRGCGVYELAVRVDCPDHLPQALAYGPFFSRESAAACVANTGPSFSGWEWVVSPYDRRPLTVAIPYTTYTSPLGRRIGRSQASFLAVVALLEDDRLIGRVIEIPDGRASKAITVSLGSEPGHAEPGVGADSR